MRRTSRNGKEKRPIVETPGGLVYWEIFSSIEPFIARAALCMYQIMLITKAAAASITQPSTMSELYAVWATATATPILATTADPSAQKTVRFSSDRPTLLR